MPHELDLLQPGIVLGRHHDAGAARQPGQHAHRVAEHRFERLLLRRGLDLRLDLLAFARTDVAKLKHGVDEKTQAKLGRQPPGAGVRRVNQAKLFEILHHIAHGGGRQRHRQQARDMARADRLAAGEIGIDDLTEDLARALVEVRQGCLARRATDRG